MKEIENSPFKPKIQGLTAGEIDPGLHQSIQLYSPLDFCMAASEARRKELGDRKSLRLFFHPEDIVKSPELKSFLEANRPLTLFYKPEDIASLLTPDSDILLQHEKSEDLETLRFVLNPKKYPDLDNLSRQKITLTRGQKEYGKTEPCLVVDFPADYKNSLIIFNPKIKITYGDNYPRNEIEKAMIELLGLKEKVVSQKLEFNVKKEKYWREEDRRPGVLTKILGRTKRVKWDTYLVEISLKK
jgi:hypothetical protein